jgi:hypothetical protein
MTSSSALQLIASTRNWRGEYRFTAARITGHGADIESFANDRVEGGSREVGRRSSCPCTPTEKSGSRFVDVRTHRSPSW